MRIVEGAELAGGGSTENILIKRGGDGDKE